MLIKFFSSIPPPPKSPPILCPFAIAFIVSHIWNVCLPKFICQLVSGVPLCGLAASIWTLICILTAGCLRLPVWLSVSWSWPVYVYSFLHFSFIHFESSSRLVPGCNFFFHFFFYLFIFYFFFVYHTSVFYTNVVNDNRFVPDSVVALWAYDSCRMVCLKDFRLSVTCAAHMMQYLLMLGWSSTRNENEKLFSLGTGISLVTGWYSGTGTRVDYRREK